MPLKNYNLNSREKFEAGPGYELGSDPDSGSNFSPEFKCLLCRPTYFINLIIMLIIRRAFLSSEKSKNYDNDGAVILRMPTEIFCYITVENII